MILESAIPKICSFSARVWRLRSVALRSRFVDTVRDSSASLLIAGFSEILPALQRDRDVAVFPNKIVEGSEVEFFSLLQSCFGEKFCYLKFANLIGEGLTRAG